MMISAQPQSKSVIINTIWFSADGSICKDALENLQKLSQKILSLGYENCYKIVLWTDLHKLKTDHKKLLESYNIKIKDFPNVALTDEQEKKFFINLVQFVSLGHDKDKLPFSMASDLLRAYIILRDYPKNYPNDVAMYIDCNDIHLPVLPHPNHFDTLHGLCASYVKFGLYVDSSTQDRMTIINSDVTIANNANFAEFEKIFQIYCNNIDLFLNNKYKTLAEKYAATRLQAGVFDLYTCHAMAFGVTHIFTLLYLYDHQSFLVEHQKDNINLTAINVGNASQYLQIDRPLGKGHTWYPENYHFFSIAQKGLVSEWTNNFISKRNIMAAFACLSKNKLVCNELFMKVIFKHNHDSDQLVKGLVFLNDRDSELLNLYQNIILTWDYNNLTMEMNAALILAKGLFGLKQNNCLDINTFQNILNPPDSIYIYNLETHYWNNLASLRTAISKEDVGSVESLLRKGVETNAEFEGDYDSLFLMAVRKGNLLVVELMLTIGKADPNQENKKHETPLIAAIKKGDTKLAELLLVKGACPNKADDANSPLIHAIALGHLEIIALLLKHGAKPNQVNQFNLPPLVGAMVTPMDEYKSNLKMMEILLDNGANTNQVCGENGTLTPLTCAIEYDFLDALKLLLAKGANVNEDTEDGFTILLCATIENKKEVVQILLENRADTNKANEVGLTPLLQATIDGNAEIVDLLLANGANPEQADKENVTPLWAAAKNNQSEIFAVLFKALFKIVLQDPHKNKLLACTDKTEFDALVKEIANVSEKNDSLIIEQGLFAKKSSVEKSTVGWIRRSLP